MSYTYKYPRPAVTCEAAIFTKQYTDRSERHIGTYILLIKRKFEPFKNMWAIPGGFMEENEELHECAARELKEETNINIDPNDLKQVITIGNKNRDPRGRIISIVYAASLDEKDHEIKAGDDASEARWYNVDELDDVALAADHAEIIKQISRKLNV